MSRTEHHRGKITKVDLEGKDVNQYAKEILDSRGIKKVDYYSCSYAEQLADELYNDFFYYPETNTLYTLDNREYEDEYELIKAYKIDQETFEYELKFYNGGVGFTECLVEALDKHYNEQKL